jgi:hypothetical protein
MNSIAPQWNTEFTFGIGPSTTELTLTTYLVETDRYGSDKNVWSNRTSDFYYSTTCTFVPWYVEYKNAFFVSSRMRVSLILYYSFCIMITMRMVCMDVNK